jgi:uncharacterized protein
VTLRVQLIHGLEGSPQGAKAQYLGRHFDLVALAMDTRDFPACVAVQGAALSERAPDVLVGSSFGGAVAAALLASGEWKGPTVLLAPAVGHFGVDAKLPLGVPVIVVHGTKDELLDIEVSRALAKTGSPELVRFVEVDDAHQLSTLLESERLADIVREAFELGRGVS